MDVSSHNSDAWNRKVAQQDKWTIPVSSEEIARARLGVCNVVLTPRRIVPAAWFPSLSAAKILALAAAGGQQGPIFAAAGADVTVFDNSIAQLNQDRMVADRERLKIKTVKGDMADLSCFNDESFDLVFNPCSNVFVPDVRRVWKEAFRVLRRGGICMSGFINPILFALDKESEARGIVQVKHKIPYSDLQNLDEPALRAHLESGRALKFGHTIEDQIGGQLDAGFAITGLYEDRGDEKASPIHSYMNCYIATKAVRQ